MSLSCVCDYDGADWWYEVDSDFSALATVRGRKCCSCKRKITVGQDVLKLRRWRDPKCDIEERIYGDEVSLSPQFLCETCGGLYMAVDELNMCCDVEENIAAQIKEYRADQL